MISNIPSSELSLVVTKEKKVEYGEVRTPVSLVHKILDLFPQSIFSNPNKTWLDVGAGTGQFSIELFKRLNKHLSLVIKNEANRHHHILTKMMYMVEIQEPLINELKKIFTDKANIIHQDFLFTSLNKKNFDCIIGNPPFNCRGIKKVPTNQTLEKKKEGKTIWPMFIKKSMEYLKYKGYLAMITPSLWMHQDKAKIYNLLLNNKIYYIRPYTNTQTNKLFKGEAQTPTCYFLVRKTNSDGITNLFDSSRDEYIRYPLRPTYPLPVFGANVVSKLIPFVTGFGHLQVTISKSPPKNVGFSQKKSMKYAYPVVKSCVLQKLQPILHIVYATQPLAFYDKPKIIMAHKMYGFPYIDIEGKLSVSYRDNFIITINENCDKITEKKHLENIRDFLSTKLALYIFEATRYRMKFLDKYAFQFIPDITRLPNLPTKINDTTLAQYFMLDEIDQQAIQKLHKKDYKTL